MKFTINERDVKRFYIILQAETNLQKFGTDDTKIWQEY
jgi:hypothetical protein